MQKPKTLSKTAKKKGTTIPYSIRLSEVQKPLLLPEEVKVMLSEILKKQDQILDHLLQKKTVNIPLTYFMITKLPTLPKY